MWRGEIEFSLLFSLWEMLDNARLSPLSAGSAHPGERAAVWDNDSNNTV